MNEWLKSSMLNMSATSKCCAIAVGRRSANEPAAWSCALTCHYRHVRRGHGSTWVEQLQLTESSVGQLGDGGDAMAHTPHEFRLSGVQLQTIGTHPLCHTINTITVMQSFQVGTSCRVPCHQCTGACWSHTVPPDVLPLPYTAQTVSGQGHCRAFSVAGPTVWNSTRQAPRPGCLQQQFQAITQDGLLQPLLSTLSAVEMLYDSALYKYTIDIDIEMSSLGWEKWRKCWDRKIARTWASQFEPGQT